MTSYLVILNKKEIILLNNVRTPSPFPLDLYSHIAYVFKLNSSYQRNEK